MTTPAEVERPYRFEYWGLRVASNFDWPELAPFAAEGALETTEVTIDRLPFEAGDAGIRPQYARLAVAGVGGYEICEGRSIRVRPEPEARLGAVQLFLFGSAWGLLCYQRGVLTLHASVVGVRGQAVALCGPSGAGKSTLAAALVGRGHVLMSDDLCRVALEGGEARVWPSLPRLKLWRQSLERLGAGRGASAADIADQDKLTLPPMVDGRRQPMSLKAIYLLAWGEPLCQRLSGATALRQLVAASLYRGEALEAMGRLAWYWRACAEVLQRCQVFQLRRPREWAGWERAMDQIEGA